MKSHPLDDQYFYVKPENVDNLKTLRLHEDEADHCVKVLRKTRGNRFYAVDGIGHEFLVELDEARKDIVFCKILETKTKPTELTVDITLAQALIKKDHFDMVVEKGTELGVNAIIPLETERSLVEPGKNRIIRWQKIAVSSMKQSRRSVLPRLLDIAGFKQLVENSDDFAAKIIFHEKSDRLVIDPAKILPVMSSKVLVLIGPEGGFTESEHDIAVNHGFISLSLGRRRLRAETAAICALSILSNLDTPQNT